MNYSKNNRLIAEFMQAPFYSPNDFDLYSTSGLNHIFRDVESDDANAQHFFRGEQMLFHNSWDWLIPVIQKIKEIDSSIGIEQRLNPFTYNLDSVYAGVIEFIKSYNHKST